MFGRSTVRFAAGFAIAAGTANAQLVANPTQGSARVVSGTIVDRESNPVGDARIGFIDHDSTVWRTASDSTGRFRLEQAPAGHFELRIRRAGYGTQAVSVEAEQSGKPTSLFIKLDPDAGATGDSTLDAPATDSISPLLRGFRERARLNHMGHFVDEKRLAELRPEFISDALRTIPGVLVRPARIGNDVSIRGCAPLVWVDGARAKGAQVDDVGRGHDVAAIEVYESLYGVPAEFMDRSATCGTILLWMK